MTMIKTKTERDGRTCCMTDDGVIHIATGGNICATEFRIAEKTPHWQRYGDGSVSVTVDGTVSNGSGIPTWMSIDTMEFGEKSSKRTIVTFDRDKIERLRDMCNLVLGDRTAEALPLLAKMHEFLKNGTPIHPGALLTDSDEPIETVIANILKAAS